MSASTGDAAAGPTRPSPRPPSWSRCCWPARSSFYASGSPDGLNKVAADKGLDEQEKEQLPPPTRRSPATTTKDVDDERLSGGLAGVVGVAVVLVFAGGARAGRCGVAPRSDEG